MHIKIAFKTFHLLNQVLKTLNNFIRKVKVKSLSHVRPFATPWTVAHQALPSMGFSRQEYWSGLPFPSPGDLPSPGIKPRSPALQADASTSEPPGKCTVNVPTKQTEKPFCASKKDYQQAIMSLNKTEPLLVAPQVGAQYFVPKTPLDSYSGFKVPSYSPLPSTSKSKNQPICGLVGTAVTRDRERAFLCREKKRNFIWNLTWRGE